MSKPHIKSPNGEKSWRNPDWVLPGGEKLGSGSAGLSRVKRNGARREKHGSGASDSYETARKAVGKYKSTQQAEGNRGKKQA